MRTISADASAILTGTARKTSVRLSVKDSGGVFRDLTTYPKENFVLSVSWAEDIDDPGITWEASLLREMELVSLAPTMANSGLNREWGIATVAALLQIGRAVRVEWAIQAEDDPGAPSWQLAFSGWLDTIDWGDDEITITGRGEEAQLIDRYVERERIYAFSVDADATKGMYVWEPARIYLAGDLVLPTDSKRNEHFYSASAGTSAATEPAWPLGAGSTVVNGGVTFTEKGPTTTVSGTAVETILEQLEDDNLALYSLTTPVSPEWMVRWFQVSRQPLFDELRLLADQIGWCLRFRYESGAAVLTLFDPDRANTTSARTFSKSETKVRAVKVEIFDIRNVVRIVYSDSQDLDSSKYGKRKSIEVSDSASITKYGRRFAEVAEDSNSNIDTSAEATTLANAILEDLREPLADFVAELMLFPYVDVTDLYTLGANDVHFSADQKLAVVGYQHRHSAEESTTVLRLRGRPASGYARWLERMTDAGGAEVHAITAVENVGLLALTADVKPVGGARIKIDQAPSKSGRAVLHELHLSTSAGFIPSSATLVASGTERSFEVGNLLPSLAYYAVVVPIIFNAGRPVRGQPSAEISFTPGRAAATHVNPDVVWGRLPLNGGFETQLDATAPPDFWSITGGSWTINVLLGTTNGISGAHYLKVATVTGVDTPSLSSAEFTIHELKRYSASAWRKFVAGSGSNFGIQITWFDIAHAVIGADGEYFSLGDSVGSWVRSVTQPWTPPSGARFARISVVLLAGASGREAHVDSAELIESEPVVTATALTAYATGGQANATALTGEVNFVATVATTADSVKLPVAVLGAKVVVFNQGANSTNVYPQTGAAIDALGTNNPYALAAGASREFWAKSATAWVSR